MEEDQRVDQKSWEVSQILAFPMAGGEADQSPSNRNLAEKCQRVAIFAIFAIRGKPYAAENIILGVLLDKSGFLSCFDFLGPLLSLMWNVVITNK